MKPIKAATRPAMGNNRISIHHAIAALKQKHHVSIRRTIGSRVLHAIKGAVRLGSGTL